MFKLPQGFGDNVSKISQLLVYYEANLYRDDRVGHELLIYCCRLLETIDVVSLNAQLEEILGDRETMGTAITQIIENEKHFSYFLDNVERAMLANAHVGRYAQDDIISRVKALREDLVRHITRISASTIIDDIVALRLDVCNAADDAFERRDAEYRRKKATKTILIALVIVNAVGTVLFAPATAAALAASVIVGGLASHIT